MPGSKLDLMKSMPSVNRTHDGNDLRKLITQQSISEDEATPQETASQQQRSDSVKPRASERENRAQERRASRISISFSHDSLECNTTPARKTIILLESHDENDKETQGRRILGDKGYSRTTQLSVLYATMLALFGVVFPISEALLEEWLSSHVVGVFMTYLFSCASLFVIYIEIYEVVLRNQRRKAAEDAEITSNSSDNRATDASDVADPVARPSANFSPTNELESTENGAAPDSSASETKTTASHGARVGFNRHDSTQSGYTVDSGLQDEVYDYITMHHSTATVASFDTNYFLKCGMLLFAVANMIYVALRIQGEHMMEKCGLPTGIIYPNYVHLPFIILQTFLLTKECKLALRKHKSIVNFGLMHLVATNFCVWFRYLVTEVGETVHHETEDADGDAYLSVDEAGKNVSNTCTTEPAMMRAGPYLFPFILEYSLVAMTTIIVIHGNINIRVTRELYKSICSALHQRKVAFLKGVQSRSPNLPDDEHRGAFENSHKSLMLGVLVLAGVVVSMVLFFYWRMNGENDKAELCYTISELVMLVLMVVSIVAAMFHLYKFIFKPASANALDHSLLLLSANSLLLSELFSFLSVISYMVDNRADGMLVSQLVTHLLSMAQAILQVTFINDGLQRVSVKEKYVRDKKGRGLITFLVILNVTMWTLESFQEKRSDQTSEILMYGDVAWAIISSVANPLQLFFYFHSAICLAHMWHHCFKEPEETDVSNRT